MTLLCSQCGEQFSAPSAETAICPSCGSVALLTIEQNRQQIYEKASARLKLALADEEKISPPWEEMRDRFLSVQRLFQAIPGYRDSDKQAAFCGQKIAEQDQLVKEKIDRFLTHESNRNRSIILTFFTIAALLVVLTVVIFLLSFLLANKR